MWQHVPKSAREHAASRDLAHPDIDENTVDMVCAWQLAVQRMPAQWTPATTRERSAFCQCLLQQSGSCSYCNEDQTTRDIERAALYADAVQRAKEIAAPATAEQATKLNTDAEAATDRHATTADGGRRAIHLITCATCGTRSLSTTEHRLHLHQHPECGVQHRVPDEHSTAAAAYMTWQIETGRVLSSGTVQVHADGTNPLESTLAETRGCNRGVASAASITTQGTTHIAVLDNSATVDRDDTITAGSSTRDKIKMPRHSEAVNLNETLNNLQQRSGGVELVQRGAHHNMPHDKTRNALDFDNRVVDSHSSTRAYEQQLNPKMIPPPRDYNSIVRAAGHVFGTKDGALITGPPTHIVEAAWLTFLQQSVAHSNQERITTIHATHVAAHAHSTGRDDTALTSALLQSLSPNERNYVRRHRLAAVQSDPAHLRHHVTGPWNSATWRWLLAAFALRFDPRLARVEFYVDKFRNCIFRQTCTKTVYRCTQYHAHYTHEWFNVKIRAILRSST